MLFNVCFIILLLCPALVPVPVPVPCLVCGMSWRFIKCNIVRFSFAEGIYCKVLVAI